MEGPTPFVPGSPRRDIREILASGEESADLSERGLRSEHLPLLPWPDEGVPPHLDLSKNNIAFLPEEFIERAWSLQALDLSFNRSLDDLYALVLALRTMEQLRSVHVAGTGLSHHPFALEFIITNVPQLTLLNGEHISALRRREAKRMSEAQYEWTPFNGAYAQPGTLPVARQLRRREHGVVGSKAALTRGEVSMTNWEEAVVASMVLRQPYPRFRLLVAPIMDPPLRMWPRQLEFSPVLADTMLVGCERGQVLLVNHRTGSLMGRELSLVSEKPMLALSWLRRSPHLAAVGVANGQMAILDTDKMRTEECAVMGSFEPFGDLTSVHVNCTDELMLASGYSSDVNLYDVQQARLIKVIPNLHETHINVVKFANHMPHVVATSSFDGTCKLWDIRANMHTPVFSRRSSNGVVMVCFSPDDRHVLSSAIDNELHQYRVVDGSEPVEFNLQTVQSPHNYTRSYYLNREYIVSGSCDEYCVRVINSSTGRVLRRVHPPMLFNDARWGSDRMSYVQSLRGDPLNPFGVAVLSMSFKTPSILYFDLKTCKARRSMYIVENVARIRRDL